MPLDLEPNTAAPGHGRGGRRRHGRNLGIVIAIALMVLTGAWIAQSYVDSWLQRDAPERVPPVYPAQREMQPFPEPEIAPAAVAVADPIEKPEPIKVQQPQPVPRPTPQQRPSHRYVELAQISINVNAQPVGPETFRDGRITKMAVGCALRIGTQIPAVLTTAIYSEIGGLVEARTKTTFYSEDLGYENKVLVPQGTRIVGVVDKGQGLNINSGRLNVVWQFMSNPAGFGENRDVTEISLGTGYGASADGSAGMGGDVKMEWGNLAIFAAISTLFTWGEIAADDDDFARAAAFESARVGRRFLDRYFDLEPKIRVPEGTEALIQFRDTLRVC